MRALLIILFFFVSQAAFSKGASGIYLIKGIAYNTDKTVLKNTALTVMIGKEAKKIMTDEKGHYEIEVRWMTACPSGISKVQWRKKTDKLNPDYILVQLDGKEIKLKNNWKQYSRFSLNGINEFEKKDLLFV